MPRTLRVLPGVAALVALVLLPALVHAQRPRAKPRFEVFEAGIPVLQAALIAGQVTSAELVSAYLARIEAYDHAGPRLNALIRLNPNALAEADALDAERRAGKVRGPLHGIPVILKDNYDTKDLVTAGSSIALAGFVPPEDAFVVKKLRDAGAIVLGKSNMHELAAGITTISSLGGQTRNPYDPTRNPGGSSGGSGAAVAASFAAIAYGSDTCGSIRIPSAVHNLFGLRPTKGLSSINGIIPLAHSQDIGGPLARSVTDLAIGLDATIGADPADPATAILATNTLPRFVAALDPTALKGARIGIAGLYFGNQPEDQEASRLVRAALAKMKENGAELVDVDISAIDTVAQRAGVINFEFRFDLMDYLAARPSAPVRSLTEILERGLYHVALEETFRARDTVKTRDGEAYRRALARRDTARAAVIALLDMQQLDAIAYPTVRRKPAIIGEPQRGANCQLSAVTGLPALSAPAGFTPDGLPIGVELLARPLADARLVALAYAYEQAARPRRPPGTTPALVKVESPLAFTVSANGAGVAAQARFTYDAARRTLTYAVRISGAPAEQIHAVTLSRGSAQRPAAVMLRLSGPAVTQADGSIVLNDTEHDDLSAGRLSLTVFTRAQPFGFRAPVMLPR